MIQHETKEDYVFIRPSHYGDGWERISERDLLDLVPAEREKVRSVTKFVWNNYVSAVQALETAGRKIRIGVVLDEGPQCAPVKEKKTKPCGSCNGSGWTWDRDATNKSFQCKCETCKGSGEVDA